MKSLESVDRWLGRHFERWSANLGGGDHPKEALEIRRDILTAIGDKVEAAGQGEYVFPYSEVTVKLAPRDAGQHATFQAAFVEEDGLQAQARDMLRDAGCQADAVALVIQMEEDAAAPPFQVSFKRVEKAPKGAAATPAKVRPAAWLYVVRGNAERPEFFIGKDVVYLGRLKEVSGRTGGLRRRNDVAFDDGETTVSREHAHIQFEEGRFRLFNDGGEAGTRLFRDGRTVEIPSTGSRGTQLISGDEIHLGEARLRFETGD